MDKLTIAHEWYMKHADGANTHMDLEIGLAWKYADAMQDEADKRVKAQEEVDAEQSKMVRETLQSSGKEWQPDWSLAPCWADWWATDKDLDSFWHENKPNFDEIEFYQCGMFCDAPSFNYQGNWQDSLRKRP